MLPCACTGVESTTRTAKIKKNHLRIQSLQKDMLPVSYHALLKWKQNKSLHNCGETHVLEVMLDSLLS
jgi:hypothetical protein